MRWISALALAACAGSAAAQTQEPPQLRPAPDYFVDTLVAMNTVRGLVRGCEMLRVSSENVQAHMKATRELLATDGFDMDKLGAQMQDPSERFKDRQQDFFETYGIGSDVTRDQLCDAARAEIEKATILGSFLVMGPQ
ncbi:MAG: DUF5333 domain-containing protein [Alphaproteobacteria bacterium]|nr:DUF5333 domain-containing protein [Alphaproteobacteria bacterium]